MVISYIEKLLNQDWSEVEAHLEPQETLLDYFLDQLCYIKEQMEATINA
jgi:hypothetical protein